MASYIRSKTMMWNKKLKKLPHSQKYWWESDLAIEPKITIARILADLNLAVRYVIAIRIMRVGNFVTVKRELSV